MADPAFTTKEVPVNRGGEDGGKVTLLFYEDMPTVPYIEVNDFQQLMLPGSSIEVTKTGDGEYLLKGPYAEATVNTSTEVFTSDDYMGFTNLMDRRRRSYRHPGASCRTVSFQRTVVHPRWPAPQRQAHPEGPLYPLRKECTGEVAPAVDSCLSYCLIKKRVFKIRTSSSACSATVPTSVSCRHQAGTGCAVRNILNYWSVHLVVCKKNPIFVGA